MNIANKVTVSRFVFTVIFVFLASFENATCNWIAYFVGFFACWSDFLDGILARRYNLITDFGKLMDPMADKIFVTAAFIVLTDKGAVPAWVTILILSREFAVTALRQIASQKGRILEAAMGGKIKTTLQFIYLGLAGLKWTGYCAYDAGVPKYSMLALMYATAAITLWTGWEYFRDNKKLYMGSL